jgi:hypothetical protein
VTGNNWRLVILIILCWALSIVWGTGCILHIPSHNNVMIYNDKQSLKRRVYQIYLRQWTYLYNTLIDRLCGLVVRVRFPALPDFLRSSGSGTGSTQPREDNWGGTWKESSGSGLENQN